MYYFRNCPLKKIFSLLLIVVHIFTFSACTSSKDDSAFLKNLKKGLEARWKISTKMDEEKNVSDSDYRKHLLECVNAEIDQLGNLTDYDFSDDVLAAFAEDYFVALDSQLNGYKYYGIDYTKYEEQFTQGYNLRAEIIYLLNRDYAFTVNSKYSDTFTDMTVVGEVFHEVRTAVLEIENQLSNMPFEFVNSHEYTFKLTNTSNLNFSRAELTIFGYDENGANIANGTGYIYDWNSGMTATDTIWIPGEIVTATATLIVNYNNQKHSVGPVEVEIINDLILNVDIPSTPIEVTYSSSNRTVTRCTITDITYDTCEWYDGETTLCIQVSGKKTYDKSGNYHSRSCHIGWKLYDDSGAVIDSGICYSGDCRVDEQFKGAEIYIYGLKPGNYRLAILNVG